MMQRNIFSNFISAGVIVLITAFCTPFYISILGIESYGLIGLFASIQSLLVLLDVGLSPAFSREIARESVGNDNAQRLRDLLRTLEVPYWLLAGGIGLVLVIVSPYLASNWVQPKILTLEIVQQIFILMSLNAAIQWPTSLYSSGLSGLQQITTLNIIRVFCSIFRYFGALGILQFWPNVLIFFIWQILSSSIQTIFTVWAMWRVIPKSGQPPQFRLELLRNLGRFAGGITLISIVGVLLIQLDKFILSRLLTLQDFGYYTFAGTLVAYLSGFAGAITSPFSPRLVQLAVLDNQAELRRVYHQGCQYVSTFMLPAAMLLIFFSEEVIMVWTNDRILVKNTAEIVRLLAIGSTINALIVLPSYLQLAYGWIKLSLIGYCLEAIFLVPFILFTASSLNAFSGAISWLLINAGFMIIALPIMHRRLLRGELSNWYREDVFIPLISIAIPIIFIRNVLPIYLTRIQLGLTLAITAIILFLFSWYLSPILRTAYIKISSK